MLALGVPTAGAVLLAILLLLTPGTLVGTRARSPLETVAGDRVVMTLVTLGVPATGAILLAILLLLVAPGALARSRTRSPLKTMARNGVVVALIALSMRRVHGGTGGVLRVGRSAGGILRSRLLLSVDTVDTVDTVDLSGGLLHDGFIFLLFLVFLGSVFAALFGRRGTDVCLHGGRGGSRESCEPGKSAGEDGSETHIGQ